jgi:hypothetical protein
MAGLDPAISMRRAQCLPNRGPRDKPGDDRAEIFGHAGDGDAGVSYSNLRVRADDRDDLELVFLVLAPGISIQRVARLRDALFRLNR